MILPSSYAVTLAVIIFGMLCWGSWASLYKAAGRVRYELFYFDFAIGMLIASVLAALTIGTLGFDGFSFMDDLSNAAKKQDLSAIVGGGVFNLGNMLLLASVSESGMSVAFPIGIGVAIAVASIWNFFLKPGQNVALVVLGAATTLFAVLLCNMAYRLFELGRADELVRSGKQKSTRRQVNAKGAVLAIIAGIILGSHFPLIANATSGDTGLGPYSVAVMFAIGVFLSTFLYNLFLMNLPISGPPLEILEYFKVLSRQHLLGFLSGAMWIAGLLASLVAASADKSAQVESAVSYGLLQGAVFVAALWGLVYWKEFPHADGRIRSLLLIMLVLFVVGIGLIAVAPVVSHS